MDMTHLKKQIIFIILLALFCMIGVIVNHRYKDTSQPQNTVDSVYFDDTANVDSTVDSVSQPLEQPEQKDIPSKVSSQNDGISKYYDRGYDKGYDDGEDDGCAENGYRGAFDDDNNYHGWKKRDFELGYEEGYEAGYDDNS